MPPPAPDRRPTDVPGLVAGSIRAGLRAWRARLGMLSAVVLAVVLVNVPGQAAQWAASARMDEVGARLAARGDRPADPAEALEDLSMMGPACCWLCGSGCFAMVAVMPLTAGALVAGARAVRGNGRAADLVCAFRRGRFLPTMLTVVVTVFIGGGAAVLVGVVNSVAVAGSASRAISSLITPAVMYAIAAAVAAVTLWLTARLWFALVRVADPDRPRVGGIDAVTQSWQWSAGPVQWRMLALVALSAAGFALCIAPAAIAPGALGGTAAATLLATALAVAGAWLGGTVGVAILGAAYELVASRSEPLEPPVVSGRHDEEGAIDG
jgi:hypothetical protein